MGRRASDCGAYFTGADFAAAQDLSSASDDVDFLSMDQSYANSPRGGLSEGSEECGSPNPAQVEMYMGGRGSVKRHTIAGAAAAQQVPDSPRKRRTGLMTVMEKPPEIPAELVLEVESRIALQTTQRCASPISFLPFPDVSPSSLPPMSPLSSPSNPPSSLRQRRTGLSTVMEASKVNRVNSLKEPHSLHLPNERYSPVRRLSEGNPALSPLRGDRSSTAISPAQPSSLEQSPCEIKALQEEYRQLNLETRLSLDSQSSGYHSPQFLRPPTPPVSLTGPRRCSESSVNTTTEASDVGSRLQPNRIATSTSAVSEPGEMIAAMYEDMYSTNSDANSRRFSYPNSPAHHAGSAREKHSLTQHLQQLCLQQKINEAAADSPGIGNRFKGSITQGVPSLTAITPNTTPAITPITTPGITPGSTPKRERRPPVSPRLLSGLKTPVITHSQSFDAAFDNHSLRIDLWGKNHSASTEDYLQFPVDASLVGNTGLGPQICVTDVMGDQINLVFSEPMDESS